ncbi:MAG: hypothetical protein GY820_10290 [Gammaproteobacteria bacterium]|nr:hypothetical protein [Gammaproteobacteria bacterium]
MSAVVVQRGDCWTLVNCCETRRKIVQDTNYADQICGEFHNKERGKFSMRLLAG